MNLTFEENLGWEHLDRLLSVAKVLHCRVVKQHGIGRLLQDCLLGSTELLLRVLLQIGRVHTCDLLLINLIINPCRRSAFYSRPNPPSQTLY